MVEVEDSRTSTGMTLKLTFTFYGCDELIWARYLPKKAISVRHALPRPTNEAACQ